MKRYPLLSFAMFCYVSVVSGSDPISAIVNAVLDPVADIIDGLTLGEPEQLTDIGETVGNVQAFSSGAIEPDTNESKNVWYEYTKNMERQNAEIANQKTDNRICADVITSSVHLCSFPSVQAMEAMNRRRLCEGIELSNLERRFYKKISRACTSGRANFRMCR